MSGRAGGVAIFAAALIVARITSGEPGRAAGGVEVICVDGLAVELDGRRRDRGGWTAPAVRCAGATIAPISGARRLEALVGDRAAVSLQRIDGGRVDERSLIRGLESRGWIERGASAALSARRGGGLRELEAAGRRATVLVGHFGGADWVFTAVLAVEEEVSR